MVTTQHTMSARCRDTMIHLLWRVTSRYRCGEFSSCVLPPPPPPHYLGWQALTALTAFKALTTLTLLTVLKALTALQALTAQTPLTVPTAIEALTGPFSETDGHHYGDTSFTSDIFQKGHGTRAQYDLIRFKRMKYLRRWSKWSLP